MKKIIILCVGLVIFTNIYAQKKIKGVSTYFSDDSIFISVGEVEYLIQNSLLVCSKIDTLEDGAMIKTVEIGSRDPIFPFIGAYVESNIFFSNDLPLSGKAKPILLKCSSVLVDARQLYELYELDSLGRKYFESVLNRAPLVCIENQ